MLAGLQDFDILGLAGNRRRVPVQSEATVLQTSRAKRPHYDLDFCRQAEDRWLKMGTCTVFSIHQCPGDFDSDGWRNGYRKIHRKWQ
jgi:hypothetical protein